MKDPIVHTQITTKAVPSKLSVFDELFDTYSKKVYSFAKSYHFCHQDAEEVVQEVFIKLWNVIDQIDAKQSVHSYIVTVTKNVILNFLRSRAVRQKYIMDNVNSYGNHRKVDNVFHFNELISHLNVIIDSLPGQQKKIFKMTIFDGDTSDLVAEKLSLSKRTVEHHLYMANKFVRKELSKFCK